MGTISGGKVIEGALSRVGSPNAESSAGNPSVAGGSKWVRGQYDFAVDGGAVGTIALVGALVIPLGAVIIGGFVDVLTALTSGGAGTAGLQVEGAGDMVAATVVSGAPWSTTGRKDVIPAGTGSTSVKATAARDISLVVAVAALTAGVVDVYLEYLESV